MAAPAALVIGTGFVGRPLARKLHARGYNVVAVTKTAESAASVTTTEPFRVVAADISQSGSLKADFLDGLVFFCASSGRGGVREYRAVFLEGTRNLLKQFPKSRLLFCSSTSVYGQTDGSTVDEGSATEPDRETGRILLAAERSVLQAGGTVARLAGLYGPDRCVPLRKLLEGSALLEGEGERWLNNLHQEDAANALLHLAGQSAPGIFNVVDNEPVHQRDWFAWVCAQVGRPVPPFGARDVGRKRAWTHKAVSNGRLRAAGWQPTYPTFREGLRPFLRAFSC
jgi:nucleoside-diphosphate-sugar epimerase